MQDFLVYNGEYCSHSSVHNKLCNKDSTSCDDDFSFSVEISEWMFDLSARLEQAKNSSQTKGTFYN